MNVSNREHFDGAAQRAALTALQQQSGKQATELAAEVGLSYNQYLRYVWGKTPLRVDQFEPFARAYGVDRRVLVDAMFPDPVAWNMADALRSRIPESDIPGYVATHAGDPIEDQQAAVEDILASADRERVRNTRPCDRTA